MAADQGRGSPPGKLTEQERERFRACWREIAEAVGVRDIATGASGGWHKARCPQHDDSTPSFSLKDDGGWKCHSCNGAGGDPVELVTWVRGCTFPEAVEECRRIAGTARPSARKQRAEPAPKLAFGAPSLPDEIRLPRHTFVSRWVYYDRGNLPVMVANRLRTADGRKTFRPEYFDGTTWKQGAPDGDRVLYRLPSLLEDTRGVLVLEGEKAADFAATLKHGLACTTSLGGAEGPRKTDWSPLKAREVVIFPDHDEPGQRYARTVARLALEAGAASVRVVAIPETTAAKLPDKWDVADLALPEDDAKHAAGVTERDVLTWIRDAKPFEEVATDSEAPDGYQLREDGLYALASTRNGESEWQKIADPIRLAKIAANEEGQESTAIVEARDRSGTWRRIPLSHADLASDPKQVWRRLADSGVWLPDQQVPRSLLVGYLNRNDETVPRTLAVSKVGWHLMEGRRWAFLLPDVTITDGKEDGNAVLTARDSVGAFNVAGELPEWQREIAEAVTGNSRLMFGVCFALAGPLLEPCRMNGAGVHLAGASSRGKTTVLEVAGSVWGGGGRDGRFFRQWRATENALENVAEGHSDTFLALDEISECDARKVGASIYMLANGSGKARQRPDSSAQRTRTWRLTFLSSGELSPAELIKAATSSEQRGGQSVRLVGLPAVVSDELGVFDRIPGDEQTKQAAGRFADTLKEKARTFYGTAGRAFVVAVSRKRDEIAQKARNERDAFILSHVPENATAEVRRIGGLFGIAYAAGLIAAELGILPWAPGDISDAVAACFNDSMRERGDVRRSTDVEAGIERLRRWFDQKAELHLQDKKVPPPRERYGYWGPERDGARDEARLFPDSFEEIVGHGSREVAGEMVARGWLERADGRHLAKKVRLPDGSAKRMFVVTAAFLQGDDDE